ncbi:hypothetical protein BDV28DRAFT_47119 [Aspergillus coremiiformis]|uniref:Uncharacterized protein n=1 Tax=Aspergillus coremiiformis TaxID=138285 RepID=A0A5N6YXG1_9EURO|nr:hypothetical protein BDV28DRAFT_47119 [Aspergillus coremiiformis]
MSSQASRLYDPFVDPSITGRKEATPSCEKQVHMTSEGKDLQDTKHGSPRIESVTSMPKDDQSGDTLEQEKPHKHSTPQESKKLKSPAAQLHSHIPRAVFQRQDQELALTSQKGGRTTSEQRSAIPVPIRSPERLGSRSNTPGEGFSGGIRVVERPRGPRPALQAGQKETSASSSVGKASKQVEKTTLPSSSSPGSWDFREMPKRPTNVYTGEYRIRPRLRIARSAEKIIMGPDSSGSTYAVTQRSNQALVQYPDTPRGDFRGRHLMEDTPGIPAPSRHGSSSTEHTPVAGTLRRCSKISLETLAKPDTKGRQFSIPRKPVNSPSLSSLFVPSPESAQSIPFVPPFPEPYKALMKGATEYGPLTPGKTASLRAETPGQSPGTSESEVTIKPQRKRTASLLTLSDFPMNDEPTLRPISRTAMQSSDASLSDLNTSFDDITSQNPSKTLTPQSARLPESRSNRMLGGFRNIFKHRSTMEQGEKLSNEELGLAIEDPYSSSTKLIKSPEYHKLDSGRTGAKASAKYPKLSGGWNKNLRLPRPSAKRPTISAPIPISPSEIPIELIPSFARPTMATRTRAVNSSREQTAIPPDGPARRTYTVAATTGSPQRTSRPSKGTQTLTSPVSKETHLPHSAGRTKLDPIASQGQTTQIESSASSSVSEALDEIRLCVDQLCIKARDEDSPDKRERYLRMALSLQQQISDYKSLEKEVAEAEASASKKRTDKCLAESILFESYAQFRAQMDED